MISFLPIQWRLTVFNALAIGVILAVLSFALFFLLREALLSDVENTTHNRASTVAQNIRDGEDLSEGDVEELTPYGVFTIVRGEEGRILFKTESLKIQNGHSDTIWREALGSGTPASGEADLSPAAPDYIYAIPVTLAGGRTLVVEAGRSYETVSDTLAAFATILAVSVFAALIFSILGAYLLARVALAPVDAVVSSAQKITESDLSERLPVAHPRDKIGSLTTTINGLLTRLEVAFARREESLSRQRRFTADASHELRTPLTSIGGYAQMLEEGGLQDQEITRESVSAIRRESERMRALVEDLLSLSRGDEGVPLKLGEHDLGTLASEAVEMARVSAGYKVSVEYANSGDRITAVVDRSRIRQVISILLDNAIKYTPEGGRVKITAREIENLVKLEVADTGIGISRDQLPHIFERFHRVDEARTAGGVGLGLAIARQIAEAHGGEIEVQSTLGEGSTFTLTFPKEQSFPDPNSHSVSSQ